MTDRQPPEADSAVPRRRAGRLEAAIITVLSAADRPLTTGEVLERLDAPAALTYSTVITTLNRLAKKGAVTRRRDGKAFRYTAIADAPGLVAAHMNRLLAEEDDRASVLRRFVSGLEPGDEEILRHLLSDPDS
ncbi:BlaI/MecI/CopY family transcriptional regulator [Nonomuraea sp. MG754425]|uniref:BlaI/MecI/CopY family transcriptional regulator n=1 Tax=Nonomuraea sp. MG754425 TaxID=2570319 RepID=UPI001F29D223|nr:BlaI/MecI/CopY family transcriptional regulator [Nonomuraea sp. MG754425]